MNECRQIESLLPPYVDGHAPLEAVAQVERHLSTCAQCRDHVVAERTARTVMRARGAHLSALAPPGLRTRIAALGTPRSAPSLGSRGRLAACAAAAAVVLMIVATFELVAPQSNVLFAAQLALDHMRCFVVELASVDAQNSNELETQYAQRHGWAVDVPPSNAEAGVTLVAARRCPFWVGSHAHLLYRTASHEVSLYVTRDDDRPPEQLRVLGHVQRIWTANGASYALVARDVPDADLDRIAGYLERETRTNPSN